MGTLAVVKKNRLYSEGLLQDVGILMMVKGFTQYTGFFADLCALVGRQEAQGSPCVTSQSSTHCWETFLALQVEKSVLE